MAYSFLENFKNRDDLKKYGSNALAIYSLSLLFGIDDIESVAAESIIDNGKGGDKKCDVIYIDDDLETAIIIQAYNSENSNKTEAKSNKASDLNAAAGWLLSSNVNDIPESLKSSAVKLRSDLKDGKIGRVEFWYVHNLPESTNVKQELSIVEKTASALLINYNANVEVSAKEVGCDTMERFFKNSNLSIQITDKLSFVTSGYFAVNDPKGKWRAISTSIEASKIHEIYQQYKDNLFSSNIRGYMGSRRSDKNINNIIKNTISSQPNNFWIYNNGITAIVNKVNNESETSLTVSGISIVNGAQTTGSIGSLEKKPEKGVFVPIRFIECNDVDTIKNIIIYNNTQNKIQASDFRSMDPIQDKLRQSFKESIFFSYLGARRGMTLPLNDGNKKEIKPDACLQSVAAFHLQPGMAYNEKTKIWEDDSKYSKFFNDSLNYKHVIFCFALREAIFSLKFELINKNNNDSLTNLEEKQLKFLKERGSIYLFMAAVSKSFESIVGLKVSDKFKIYFKEDKSIDELISIFKPVLSPLLSLSEKLIPGLELVLKNKDIVNNSLEDYSSLVDAIKSPNKEIFEEFKTKINF